MQEYTIRSEFATTVAIDQHARTVTMAALDLSTGETKTKRLDGCPSAADMASWAQGWATPPFRFVYESGPCAFQLARDMRALGHACDVIAVTSIARSSKDRQLKDDRHDAQSLLDAVTAPSSGCRAVWVPSEEAEAARDLVRAYYDLVLASKRLKLQTSALLLRHGLVWNERNSRGNLKPTWTKAYVDWAKSAKLPQAADQATLKMYLECTQASLARCREAAGEIRGVCASPRFKPYVDALTRLMGVDEVTALAFASSVDDFSRFRNGRSVSKYFGLTPTRSDSGERTGRNGRITKAGDSTVRRAVIEGLASIPNWKNEKKHLRKGHEVSAAVELEARKCNRRNRERYRDLVARKKGANVAKTAVASEMVRDMWAIGLIVRGELEG